MPERYKSPYDKNTMDRFFTWLFPETAKERDETLRILDACIAEAKKQNELWQEILKKTRGCK